MDESSSSMNASARKNRSMILRRLASTGLKKVGAELGLSESLISKWKGPKDDGSEGEIARMALFLSVLGLKVTPQEYRCYDEATLAAMITLANQRMSQIQEPEHLAFEDEE
ncbi:CII family transcriptional regulator [Achromobacter xylosoxidans]|uniref:CII family transcriptional regulator n=1 Tax=Alcaligenes xylosoxydans xylosoxydans TaxID=85698 RepID=UPI000D69DDC9|nr:CII family transcriptional regulator [Achromobacter xylosoxidans]